MRTSKLVAAAAAWLCLTSGCLSSKERPLGDGGAVDGRVAADGGGRDGGDGGGSDGAIPCDPASLPDPATGARIDKVDLLFMVDNSNSMAEEQASLTSQFDRLVALLVAGDRDEDGTQDFPRVANLNVGVITSDMGTGGYRVPTCNNPDTGDDGVLRTVGNTTIAGCDATYPKFLNYMPPAAADPAGVADLAQQFACVASVGTGGCGFEQQLEAVLKALTPATCTDEHCTFVDGTRGHGGAGGANDGFVRADSLLAIVVLTDEEDCSASDTEIFNPASAVYREDLNLRCFYNPSAVHPTDRYVRGLLSLRDDPTRLLFAVIAGVPTDLVSDPLNVNFDTVLADPRMVEEEEAPVMGVPPRLRPSCNVPGRGIAFPPRRLVTVARDLDAQGATGVVLSICQEDFRPAFDGIVGQLAARLRGECP